MNRTIFLTSFFSIQRRGSKPRTSPAIRQSKFVVSKWVIGPMPLFPATMFFHTSSVPMPHPQTRPTPVTTTRRFNAPSLLFGMGTGELFLRMLLDVSDRVLHGRDFFCVFVRNLDAERLFEGHDEFDRIQ